jgi:GNAT superfamily N-acetyltransferase
VAEREGQVLGMVGLLAEGEEAEVEPLVVARAERGQGIGRALLAAAVAAARERGARFLSVCPVARNAAAIGLFYEAGFRLLGQVELFQDLDPSSPRRWVDGVTIQGRRLGF